MGNASLTVVVGGTGLLGFEVVRLLGEQRKACRALLRDTVRPEQRAQVSASGANIFSGDLRNPSSLADVCREATTVISTATATGMRQPGDSVSSVDDSGQLALVDAAERASVKHFVFVSFLPTEVDFALQRAKRRVEARLRESTMSFTVLQPANFMEVWLSPAVGFDPIGGKARVFGDGSKPVSWISSRDVARFAVAAADGAGFAGKVLPLGGPDPLSPLQVLKMFEEMGAPKAAVEHVPESALTAMVSSAGNDVEQAYAAIMLATAKGQMVDPQPQLRLLPGNLHTVREYARARMSTPS